MQIWDSHLYKFTQIVHICCANLIRAAGCCIAQRPHASIGQRFPGDSRLVKINMPGGRVGIWQKRCDVTRARLDLGSTNVVVAHHHHHTSYLSSTHGPCDRAVSTRGRREGRQSMWPYARGLAGCSCYIHDSAVCFVDCCSSFCFVCFSEVAVVYVVLWACALGRVI